MIHANIIEDNRYYGISMYNSSENLFSHNNFVNNIAQVYVSNSASMWNESIEGNYWSDYTGVDHNHDGIGDSSHVIDSRNKDNHPLMGVFSDFSVVHQRETYHIITISNSTISSFRFDYRESTISFDVTGDNETSGFCRVMIPRSLVEPYAVMVGEHIVDSTELPISNSTHAFLYFTYAHSTYEVTIVPELWYLYHDLLDKHAKLLMYYDLLLGNYSHLLDSYDTLNASYYEHLLDHLELQVNYTSLLTNYNSLQISYDNLEASSNELQSGQENLINELSNIRNLMYIFIATTIVLIVAIVLLARKTAGRANYYDQRLFLK